MHLTPLQRRFARRKLRSTSGDPSETSGELNIVPFLDIVVNLVMFLLVTTIVAIAATEVHADLPTHGRPCRGIGCRRPLDLTVALARDGFWVSGNGGNLGAGCGEGGTAVGPTVPFAEDGGYDHAALAECLRRVKDRYPDEDTVILTADPTIPYEELVGAMDASRSDAEGPLFTRVLLAAGVR